MDFLVCSDPADQDWADWVCWGLVSFGHDAEVFKILSGENKVFATEQALKPTAKSEDARRILVILTPRFQVESVLGASLASLHAADPTGTKRQCIPVLVFPTGRFDFSFLGGREPIDICECDETEALQRLLDGIDAQPAKPPTKPPFPAAKPAFPPQQPAHRLEAALCVGPSKTDPLGILAALFEKPPVSAAELKQICLAALPAPIRTQFPADADGQARVRWLLSRGTLSNGRAPLLDIVATLLPWLADPDEQRRVNEARATLAGQLGMAAESGQPVALSVPAGSTALLVEIWPVTPSSPNRCNAHVHWFRGKQKTETPYACDGDSALRLDDREALAAFTGKLLAKIGAEQVPDERLVLEFALGRELISHPVDLWPDLAGDPLGTRLQLVVRSRERFRDSSWWVDWDRGWNALAARFDEPLPDPLWWCGAEERRKATGKPEEGVCIALRAVPECGSDFRSNLPAYLAYKGAPALLWTRREDGIATFREDLESGLRGQPLGELPNAVRNIRRQHWEDCREEHACYHVSLLWDDPARRLPDPVESSDFLEGPLA